MSANLSQIEQEALLCDCAVSLMDRCPIHWGDPSLWVDVPAALMQARAEAIIAARRARLLNRIEKWADRWGSVTPGDTTFDRAYVAGMAAAGEELRARIAEERER